MLVATSLLDTHFLSHASDFSTPALVRVRFLINPHVGFASCCVFRTTFCWYSRFAFSRQFFLALVTYWEGCVSDLISCKQGEAVNFMTYLFVLTC